VFYSDNGYFVFRFDNNVHIYMKIQHMATFCTDNAVLYITWFKKGHNKGMLFKMIFVSI